MKTDSKKHYDTHDAACKALRHLYHAWKEGDVDDLVRFDESVDCFTVDYFLKAEVFPEHELADNL